ncbi:NAD(P)/FAD-dependent oxidoreductase [Luteolibacter sp. LG18]|uniref:NAD(P)/FAD-dependent oxidoreductase n=1 Tax=Luteolibacter sp. LG18 TaxID=2819286 RepID=UPI002B293A31|nr:nucleotide-disulfide oxidoreductase [Luteolibacter sp. LG18]
MKYDILVLGGGFAGAYCAKALGANRSLKVGLVAERNVLVFQPMLAEVAGATLSPLDVVHPLRHFCKTADILQGKVKRIDWAAKKVIVDGGRFTRNHEIEFDQLVLTLGSVTDLSKVPGMTEYGLPMKNAADAMRIRSSIINRLEEANLVEDEAVRQRLITFVIVGGGYTGVETAGQVLDLVNSAKQFYANLRDKKPRVVLIHSRPHLLEEIGPDLGDHAQRVLEKRGMEIILNSRVSEATSNRIHYAEGQFIETNTIISSIGNAPNPAVMDLCKQLGIEAEKGRVATEPGMRVKGQDKLWAAGDCAAVPWNDDGELKTSPPTAQLALRQGRQLGLNILRALRGEPLQPFTHRYLGQLATVGAHEAVAEILGFRFSGFVAWWMWRSIYLSKLPGFGRKLRVMIDWTFELFFPRDLSAPLPVPEDPMPSVHFEVGENFAERGDPCRAVLLVRTGKIIASAPGEPDREYGPGSVIGQDERDAAGCWTHTLVAGDRTDAVLFRGRALDLLRSGVRIEALAPAATPSSAS